MIGRCATCEFLRPFEFAPDVASAVKPFGFWQTLPPVNDGA